MKKSFLPLLIFICIFSCKKSDKATENNPAENKITYTVDSLSIQPGLFLTLKGSEFLTKDTCTVQLAGRSIVLAKIDSFHYVFFVPVLNPGTYKLDLTNLNSGNNPEVVIRNYAVISNPDDVITTAMKNYNNIIDSLVKNSINNAVTSTDATFIHQLMDQLSANMQLCSAQEKLLLAYQFQNMDLDKTFAEKSNLDTAHLAFKPIEQKDEVGNKLIFYVIKGENATVNALIAIPIVAGSIFLAAKVKQPLLIVAAIAAIGNLYIKTRSATKANEETFDFTGTALDPITEVNGNGTTANPIVVSAGKIFLETLQSSYRTLFKSDETSLNKDISNLIKVVYELVKKDAIIKSLFDNLKSQLNTYFNIVTVSYSAYVSPVLGTAKQKIAKINNEFVSVSNVSNPAITVTAVDDGKNGLKLTFDNPSKNIATKTDFNFRLTYTQAAIDNKVSITEQATFTPASRPTITTTIPSSITLTSAISGGIITNDGGTNILAKGLTHSLDSNFANSKSIDGGNGSNTFLIRINGLTPSTKYYIRAYATNSAGTAYGKDVSFVTSTAANYNLVGIGSRNQDIKCGDALPPYTHPTCVDFMYACNVNLQVVNKTATGLADFGYGPVWATTGTADEASINLHCVRIDNIGHSSDIFEVTGFSTGVIENGQRIFEGIYSRKWTSDVDGSVFSNAKGHFKMKVKF